MCGVDGRAIGVRLVPVLFESFLDSALGGGELHGCGFFGGVQDRLGTGGVGCGATDPAIPLDSGPVSSTGQAFRRNDG